MATPAMISNEIKNGHKAVVGVTSKTFTDDDMKKKKNDNGVAVVLAAVVDCNRINDVDDNNADAANATSYCDDNDDDVPTLSFQMIPDVILLDEIILYVGPIDTLQKFGLINKRYNKLATSNQVWTEFCKYRSSSTKSKLHQLAKQHNERREKLLMSGSNSTNNNSNSNRAAVAARESPFDHHNNNMIQERAARFEKATSLSEYRDIHTTPWPIKLTDMWLDHSILQWRAYCSRRLSLSSSSSAPPSAAVARATTNNINGRDAIAGGGVGMGSSTTMCFRPSFVSCCWPNCLYARCNRRECKNERRYFDSYSTCDYCKITLCNNHNTNHSNLINACVLCKRAACRDCGVYLNVSFCPITHVCINNSGNNNNNKHKQQQCQGKKKN